jgi:16S rRNA (uracil1498-N3)-methyltransferase
VARRVHVGRLTPGQFSLDPAQAHHVRDVLRLTPGAVVELFDDDGATAEGSVVMVTPSEVVVEAGEIRQQAAGGLRWTVASAVPKAARADWLVEKLSELGADAFVPLATARSVVHPEGKNKLDRWRRIALESAKQSRRPGVMRVEEMVEVGEFVKRLSTERREGWYLSTAIGAVPVAKAVAGGPTDLVLLIGPEGGWTVEEEGMFEANGLTGVSLTGTILRVETAAVAAGAVVACLLGAHHRTTSEGRRND